MPDKTKISKIILKMEEFSKITSKMLKASENIVKIYGGTHFEKARGHKNYF